VTARRVAFVLVAVLGFYLLLLGQRGVLLVRDGRLPFVLLGVGVLVLPLVGAWTVWREVQFGLAAQRLGEQLAAEGGLPTDELPRLPSGRVDLAAADVVFERRRADVDAAPDDWRAWYRLALAYGDARDTRRGRRAMRHAIRLRATR